MSEAFSQFQESFRNLPPAVQGSGVELLLHLVDDETATLLRLCAIPHEFSPPILMTLFPKLNEAAAEEQYERLASFPFVTVGAQEGTLHDQVRRELFAFWLAEENRAGLVSASRNLVAYFEVLSAQAIGWAREQFVRKRMFHLIGCDACQGLTEFEHLCRQARYQYRFSDCHALIRLVHEYDAILDRNLIAKLAYHEGKLAADLHQWEEAEGLFRQIVENGIAVQELKSKAYFRLGTVSAEQGRHLEAIAQYESALLLGAAHQNGNGQVYRILSALGTAYREVGQFERAQELLKQSLKLAESAGDVSELATTHNSLGTLYAKVGDATRAIEAYNRSLSYLEQGNDRLRAAQVYNNLGTTYANQRDWHQAEREYQRSLEISRAGGDTWGQAKTLNNLTRIYQILGKPERAVEVCEQAIDLFKQLRDFRNAALVQRNLARHYRGIKNIDQARLAFTEAIDLFLRSREEREVASTREELALLMHRVTLPWWAWTTLIALGLMIVVLIALIIWESL